MCTLCVFFKNEMKGAYHKLWSPYCSQKEPYLCTNSALLSHKTREDEEVTVSGLPRTVAITTESPWSPLSHDSWFVILL